NPLLPSFRPLWLAPAQIDQLPNRMVLPLQITTLPQALPDLGRNLIRLNVSGRHHRHVISLGGPSQIEVSSFLSQFAGWKLMHHAQAVQNVEALEYLVIAD